MRARRLTLVAALLLIALLSWQTVTVAMFAGISVLTLVSILVLALLAFGIVGALRNPPQD